MFTGPFSEDVLPFLYWKVSDMSFLAAHIYLLRNDVVLFQIVWNCIFYTLNAVATCENVVQNQISSQLILKDTS